MKVNRTLIGIGIIVFLISPVISTGNSPAGASSHMIYVGGNGESNYTNIQPAINSASDGDIIYVYNKMYLENIFVDKSVTIVGQNKDLCIIDGTKTGNVITLSANGVCIENFSIQNSNQNLSYSALNYAGVLIKSDFNIISNCDITKCDDAITLENSSNTNLTDCEIFNNACGINCYNSSNIQIFNCSIFSNNFSHGVSLLNSDNNCISYCNISANRICGIAFSRSSNNQIIRNTFWKNSFGTYLFLTSQDICQGNIFSENNFIENDDMNALDDCYNSWDNGIMGNYWDSYVGVDGNDDGLGDTPYNIPGGNNQDNYPLIKPLKLEGITPSSINIDITYPQNNATVNGTICIRGIAVGIDIENVKIRVDQGEWQITDGTTSWQINLNTSKYEQGFHSIQIQASDKKGYSETKHITIYVENISNEGKNDVSGFKFLLSLCAIFLTICVARFTIRR